MAEQIVRLCRTGAGRMGSRGPASPGLQSQTFAEAVPRDKVTISTKLKIANFTS